MKYIRTKDGRIISEDDIPNYYGGLVSVVGLDLDYREADTIKELCDEFVYQLKSGGKFIDEALANNFDIYENIYGAIWTDKGLIYVAKLNEKGEWELI